MPPALLERLLARLPYRRSPRLAAIFVLTSMACWGEPGARGAASPVPPMVAGPQADDSDPILVPARPPTPLPPEAPPAEAPPLSPPAEAATVAARPTPVSSQVAARVAPKLATLSSWVRTHRGQLGFALRDLGSGRELLAEGSGQALNPASNQKLITAAVALSELGPDFRFHVGILGKIEGGVSARLVLRGNGDPSLSYEDLQSFGRRLVALGLKRVTGDILVDQSAFDDRYTPPAFDEKPAEWAAFRAPVSGVSLERNSTTLLVFPTQPGKLARVEFDPPGYVAVQGDVRTEKGKRRDHVGLTLMPQGLLLRAQVSGGIPEGQAAVRISRRIHNPEIYAARVLKHVLLGLGIEVSGEAKRGGEDERQELVGRDSNKLSELVQLLGKASDNFYAETLFKALGAEKRGKPGSAESAVQVITEWLKSRQLTEEGLKIRNGSGLYDANRVSARTLTRLLETAYLDPAISHAYVDQLALAGLDGTLRGRFTAIRSRRSVHAKTGTLNQVTALSGYAFGPARETGVAFSVLVSGTSAHAEIRQHMDALVSEISDALWAPRGALSVIALR